MDMVRTEIHRDSQGYPYTDYMIHQAFAGGMVLALCCDYRIITSGKGFMCMNEVKSSRSIHICLSYTTNSVNTRSLLAPPFQNRLALFLRIVFPILNIFETLSSPADGLSPSFSR